MVSSSSDDEACCGVTKDIDQKFRNVIRSACLLDSVSRLQQWTEWVLPTAAFVSCRTQPPAPAIDADETSVISRHSLSSLVTIDDLVTAGTWDGFDLNVF